MMETTQINTLSEKRRTAGLKGVAALRRNRAKREARDRKIRREYDRLLKLNAKGGNRYGVVKVIISQLCREHNLGKKSIERIIYN